MKEIVQEILNNFNLREQDIIFRRYGLTFKEIEESLEAIGRDYHITRERVRQIQNKIINKLKPIINNHPKINEFTQKVKSLLEPLGIKEENRFYSILLKEKIIEREDIKFVKFILIFREDIVYHKGDEILKSLLAKEKDVFLFFKHLSEKLYKLFSENINKILLEEEVLNLIEQELKRHINTPVEKEELMEVLRILRGLYKNPFNHWGLDGNKFVVPSSLKEKIYLILKNEGKPMHFSQIYERLEELRKIENEFLHFYWKKTYSLDSLKNELIKHDDFVLVGRGIYALKEFGYPEGTIYDLIKNFISEKKITNFNEIYNFISNLKIFKPNTLIIYLYKLQKEGFIQIDKNNNIILKNV
ncbi:MAG: hypothetical protein C4348_01370 [Patescibacteria group bacterium]